MAPKLKIEWSNVDLSGKLKRRSALVFELPLSESTALTCSKTGFAKYKKTFRWVLFGIFVGVFALLSMRFRPLVH